MTQSGHSQSLEIALRYVNRLANIPEFDYDCAITTIKPNPPKDGDGFPDKNNHKSRVS